MRELTPAEGADLVAHTESLQVWRPKRRGWGG